MLPPLRFVPLAKARAWGADRLARWNKPGLGGQTIGETWEIADLPDSIPDGRSIVAEGPFAGRTLRELRVAHREDLLGEAVPAPDGAFPLLVKYLDAAENLSLQVHPDERFVARHHDAHLKTEAWIVVACEPGARVYRGINPATTRAAFEDAIRSGRALDHIEVYEVEPGDCVYLPSGVCHALGGGILAAEVQTPSDTTFRVWDWNRNDPKRPLHLEEAFECLKFGKEQFDGVAGFVRSGQAPAVDHGDHLVRTLCRAAVFTVDAIEVTSPAGTLLPLAPAPTPEVWMVIAGASEWRTTSGVLRAAAGDTILRPASVEPGGVQLTAGTKVIRLGCPAHGGPSTS